MKKLNLNVVIFVLIGIGAAMLKGRSPVLEWQRAPDPAAEKTARAAQILIKDHASSIAKVIPKIEAKAVLPYAKELSEFTELKKKGLDSGRIALSLERQMRCGVGKCGHCSIEHLYCCQDGPVFWLNEIEHLLGAL